MGVVPKSKEVHTGKGVAFHPILLSNLVIELLSCFNSLCHSQHGQT